MQSKVYLILLVFTMCCYSCSDESIESIESNESNENIESDCVSENSSQITLPNGDFLTIPPCWEHVVLQGVDSDVGRITYEKEGIFISYDIGIMAGSYVEPSSTSKVIENSVNEEFWYEEVDIGIINDKTVVCLLLFLKEVLQTSKHQMMRILRRY